MSFQGNGRKIAAVTLIVGIAAFFISLPFAVKPKQQALSDGKKAPTPTPVPGYAGFEPVHLKPGQFMLYQHQQYTQ
jgi:hypothetical protein